MKAAVSKAGSATDRRKLEHLEVIARDPASDRSCRYFDAIRLAHRALPELDRNTINTQIQFLNKTLSFPLLISSMTGGSAEELATINHNLARAAEAEGVAMAVGSQRVMLGEGGKNAEKSFALREKAPSTVLLGNLGAAQLNKGFGEKEARRAVEVMHADGLYLHLNPLQEAIQPEGDTDWRGLAVKIGLLNKALNVPVLVKEVGAGIGPADARLLWENGIRHIDVAGSGGTSWSRIEHHRRYEEDGHDIGLLFQDWGWPTPRAIVEVKKACPEAFVIASGGIRSGVDMAKAMVLGADLCAMAGPLLAVARVSSQAVQEKIAELRLEFVTAMFLLGCGKVEDLRGNHKLLMDGLNSGMFTS